MKLYFIPGLGADKRVFRHIRLPEGYEMVHLDWLPPQEGEGLREYALRMAEMIQRNEPWGVVGLSFGGMIASEISRTYNPRHTILIASIATASQLPPYFRWAAPLQMHRYLPIGLFKQASVARRLFTTETSEDKELLRRIIDESDPAFIRWALGAILQWRQADAPRDFFHIHGTGDHLLPLRYVSPTHTIAGGGHLMVMNRAEEVNGLLETILRSA